MSDQQNADIGPGTLVAVDYGPLDVSIDNLSNVSGAVTDSRHPSQPAPVQWTCQMDSDAHVRCSTTTTVTIHSIFDTLSLKFDVFVPAGYQGPRTLTPAVTVAQDGQITDRTSDTIHINPAPALSTSASGPVLVGSPISDHASLSGGTPPLTGTVSFELYAPRPANSTVSYCDASLRVTSYSSSVAVDTSGQATSDPSAAQQWAFITG